VECFCNKIKRFRRVFTHYEKLLRNYFCLLGGNPQFGSDEMSTRPSPQFSLGLSPSNAAHFAKTRGPGKSSNSLKIG
jgi:hypothetical protein